MLRNQLMAAPLMGWTNSPYRYFLRLLSKKMVLFTEMVTTGAILRQPADLRHRLLRFKSEEKPLVLQLGGNNPQDLAECAKIAEDYGYSSVNLNVGCPSSRVQEGCFGAVLMKNPECVAECLEKMQRAVSIPITIKMRIGVDELDSYDYLVRFVEIVRKVSCSTFIIHARKAFLSGLNPKENRKIPPLLYNRVYQIKKDFPELNIIMNGGITTLVETVNHLQKVDGVMIGRAFCQRPYFLAELENHFFNTVLPAREEIISHFLPLIEAYKEFYTPYYLLRPLLQLFHGMPGASQWKQALSQIIQGKSSLSTGVNEALIQQLNRLNESLLIKGG